MDINDECRSIVVNCNCCDEKRDENSYDDGVPIIPDHLAAKTIARIPHDKLYVIAMCSNPIRYQARYKLFHTFKKHMESRGAKVITVEIAYGERNFILTKPNNPYDVQLFTKDELWHKENAINLGINHLTRNIDSDWKYVAWVDGDINFVREDIIFETVHQLQHFPVVQMFSHCIDLGPNYEPMKTHNGFAWSYWQNDHNPPKGAGNGGYYTEHKSDFWHPGYAWAARREFFEHQMLLDRAIVGSGDHHMALGLIGEAHRSIPSGVTDEYRQMVLEWEKIALHHIRKNLGYVSGTITHNWHGKKKNRKYIERWDIIKKNSYNPYADVQPDHQGVFTLSTHHNKHIGFRDDIRRYFRGRDEDSIDLE